MEDSKGSRGQSIVEVGNVIDTKSTQIHQVGLRSSGVRVRGREILRSCTMCNRRQIRMKTGIFLDAFCTEGLDQSMEQ